MSKAKPEKEAGKEPEIQMTPVGFSPTSSEDSIGAVGGRVQIHERQYPLAIPLGIVLLTLIFSTVRDISGFNRRIGDIDRHDAPILEKLKRVPKQAEFVDSLKASLLKLSETDPVAAKIVREYFPQPGPAASGNPANPGANTKNQGSGSSAPAK
jgi:hypothetical protein